MYLIYLYLGRTSLIYAAWVGYTEIVKILLEHGADVNTKDYEGQLPLSTYLSIYLFIYMSSNLTI